MRNQTLWHDTIFKKKCAEFLAGVKTDIDCLFQIFPLSGLQAKGSRDMRRSINESIREFYFPVLGFFQMEERHVRKGTTIKHLRNCNPQLARLLWGKIELFG